MPTEHWESTTQHEVLDKVRSSDEVTFSSNGKITQSSASTLADIATTPIKDVAILAQNPIVRAGKLMDLDLVVNEVRLTTIPDTGAHINAIPLSTLELIHQRTENSNGESSIIKLNGRSSAIKLGNDTQTKSLFQVQMKCRLLDNFPDRGKSNLIVFHVFAKLATGIVAIIGLDFLEATNILTSQSFRLKERFNPMQHIPRCVSVETIPASGLRLKIFLNEILLLAVPDTGSEINLMLRFCAVRNSFEIIALPEDETHHVEFADGQIESISGKVTVAINAAGYSKTESQETALGKDRPFDLQQPANGVQEGDAALQTFYVLDSLTHEVILSQHLLHSMDVWNRHSSAFETVQAQGSSGELCTILSRRVKTPAKETSKFTVVYIACTA